VLTLDCLWYGANALVEQTAKMGWVNRLKSKYSKSTKPFTSKRNLPILSDYPSYHTGGKDSGIRQVSAIMEL